MWWASLEVLVSVMGLSPEVVGECGGSVLGDLAQNVMGLSPVVLDRMCHLCIPSYCASVQAPSGRL